MNNQTTGCGWQGYGFGAPYQDAACCGGEIGDLDDCDEPGGPIGLSGEQCPQCASDRNWLGPMALIRQRMLDECLELCDAIEDEELRDLVKGHFRGWHGLVNQLESDDGAHKGARP